MPPNSQNRRQFLFKLSLITLAAGAGKWVWDQDDLGNRIKARLPKLGNLDEWSPATKQEKIQGKRSYQRKTILPHEKNYEEFIAKLKLRYISPHEVISAHRRERSGVKNSLPPRTLWNRIKLPLQMADTLRSRLGCRLEYIASAYRSPAYNAKCPGAATQSYHMKNCALDLVFDCAPEEAMREAKKMRREGLFKGGLGLYRTFIHIDTRGRNATWG